MPSYTPVIIRVVGWPLPLASNSSLAPNIITFNIDNEIRFTLSIEITDMTGKKAKAINAGNESCISTKLSLENFAKGVY